MYTAEVSRKSMSLQVIYAGIQMLKSGAYNNNSSPSLIRPPYMPRICGRIRKVAFGEREK